MTDSQPRDPAVHFSLVVGGPFHSVLSRLGLTAADGLPSLRAAVILALLAWTPPALLAVVQTMAGDGYSGWGYFTDLTAQTRYLIAIAAMIATERVADGRLTRLARQFSEAGILGENGRAGFTVALATADRRSSSAAAEAILLAAALIWTGFTGRYAVAAAGSSWEGTAVSGIVVWSWAGNVCRFLSSPLFLFLALRWIWRFLVWAELLFRISRLPLRLMPLHPDRAAGLGFLSAYPRIFSGFVFAVSCVVASSILKELSLKSHETQTIWLVLAVWLMTILCLFLGPLFVFAGHLYAARERGLLEYGRLAHQHHLAFHRKWLEGAHSGAELVGGPDVSSASDINACLQTVQSMRSVPVDTTAVGQLVVVAGIPLLAVVATRIPLVDIVKWIVGTIL